MTYPNFNWGSNPAVQPTVPQPYDLGQAWGSAVPTDPRIGTPLFDMARYSGQPLPAYAGGPMPPEVNNVTQPFMGNSVPAGMAAAPQVTTAAALAAGNKPAGFWGTMVGNKDNPGWGGMALGAASGLASTYLGMQQYGLAKDQLKTSKAQFERNWGAQRQLTNSRLEDRQRARVASNAGAYQSVGDYMSQNGVR